MSAAFKGWRPEGDLTAPYQVRFDLGFYAVPQVKRQAQEAWLNSPEASGFYFAQQYYSSQCGGWITYFFSDEQTARKFQQRFGGYDPTSCGAPAGTGGTERLETAS